jgi:transposase
MSTNGKTRSLYVAFDLGLDKWLIACASELGQNPRRRTIPAGNIGMLIEELTKAKARFDLPPEAPVHTCYEAGRDGFWLHRCWTHHGLINLVVDSASIQGTENRRSRQPKTDRLDAGKLLGLLMRHHAGEKVWSIVNVPSREDEDRRQLHRGLKDLQHQQTRCSNRIKGLLATVGVAAAVDIHFREQLDSLRDWNDQPIPQGLRQRILQEVTLWELLYRQIQDVRNVQGRVLCHGTEPWLEKARRLMGLKGIGVRSAWLFVSEVFGWRQIRNGKELGALLGLTPTPHASGRRHQEQGISKAGNRHIRGIIIEVAWIWLRLQPRSRLSQWYQERFGTGSARMRKIGIVALARKLLIALWRYVDHGVKPEGAEEKDWKLLVSTTARRQARQAAPVAV